ncbi:hydroxyisourate hydrolase [Vreelandella andesensis]|uniref:5-hydroxyisourate hydrolase n=1 Tax=Vreelandella andesensis TaxID=447567 RepID=A0A433KHM4_9GAMM|nr:hydroxyisourate hydrolase [Halomonas andesensis]RUR28621.1 hydroxyisourate hydrolase [Halomonas andesensis]
MGYVTTHVLDTAHGCPGEGVKIDLYRVLNGERRFLKTIITNDDGRCDHPLLEGAELQEGEYELEFYAGDYFASCGGRVGKGRVVNDSEPAFLNVIPLRFGVNDATQHYHVPLLVSPYAYSTYRGS